MLENNILMKRNIRRELVLVGRNLSDKTGTES